LQDSLDGTNIANQFRTVDVNFDQDWDVNCKNATISPTREIANREVSTGERERGQPEAPTFRELTRRYVET